MKEKRLKKAQHRWRCSPQTIRYPRVACTIVWQPWAIKSGIPMGFVNSANILCTPLFHLTRDEIKKAQHLWRCTPCYILTQGSSLRSPTLGYQKQNPYGGRQFCKHPLRPLFLLKWLSKAEGDGVRQFCKHPLRPLFLLKWLSKAEPRWGSSILQTSSACVPPLLGEGLGVRL